MKFHRDSQDYSRNHNQESPYGQWNGYAFGRDERVLDFGSHFDLEGVRRRIVRARIIRAAPPPSRRGEVIRYRAHGRGDGEKERSRPILLGYLVGDRWDGLRRPSAGLESNRRDGLKQMSR
ncbi:hypothetical protein TNCV_3077551 [Trichonephila clavipes]|nr:hypothetical protein TNCV_3077551 [Trichonephila clavipes]